jgi:hypothetical protein
MSFGVIELRKFDVEEAKRSEEMRVAHFGRALIVMKMNFTSNYRSFFYSREVKSPKFHVSVGIQ